LQLLSAPGADADNDEAEEADAEADNEDEDDGDDGDDDGEDGLLDLEQSHAFAENEDELAEASDARSGVRRGLHMGHSCLAVRGATGKVGTVVVVACGVTVILGGRSFAEAAVVDGDGDVGCSVGGAGGGCCWVGCS
jgi:hypothetical protein